MNRISVRKPPSLAVRAGLTGMITVALLLSAFAAHAGDGVIEISQTQAEAGGVTSGDTPGFPVTLSAPGSYRLTSNLDVRNEPSPADISAIVVEVAGAFERCLAPTFSRWHLRSYVAYLGRVTLVPTQQSDLGHCGPTSSLLQLPP